MPPERRIVTISVTEAGRRLGEALPYHHLHGSPRRALEEVWGEADGIVLILAVGASARLLAPLLEGKHTDPAVICLDDAGQWAVALLGGHAGGARSAGRVGANDLAREVSSLVGSQPVVTTASDAAGFAAFDSLGEITPEGDTAGVSAAILNRSPVLLENPLDWPLPASLTDAISHCPPPADQAPRPAARVVISDLARPQPGSEEDLVVLRPRSLVVGIGCSTTASAAEARRALEAALATAGLSPLSLGRAATISRRAAHPAVVGLGLEVSAFGPDQLGGVSVPNPSDAVLEAVGTPSVAEAAALIEAGAGAELVLPKQRSGEVTIAIARRHRPPGSLKIVGLGPGLARYRTPAADAAVRTADFVIGYSPYVDQASDLLGSHQEVVRSPIGAEEERARQAIEAAACGRRVALVCSGDSGVYGMASVTLEVLGQLPHVHVEIEVIPGVTAALVAAAALGAPLGHDHALISLSDLHTPWEAIAERVDAAGRADFAVAFYNPRSAKRDWQLDEALGILAKYRPGTTPLAAVTDAGRPGESIRRSTLGAFDTTSVTMTTCVIVGTSSTAWVGTSMVTPRGLVDHAAVDQGAVDQGAVGHCTNEGRA